MSRKHILQKQLQQDIDPPGEGQHVVRAVGSRGSNIIEVQFPDGRNTLCLLPAKFHKKLWIKRGNYLIIENVDDIDAAVTGHVVQILFADHVKQLKRTPGVWPEEFDDTNTNINEDSDALVKDLENLDLDGNNNSTDENNSTIAHAEEQSSDEDLPPIVKIQNRRVVEYAESDSSDSNE